MRRDFIFAIRTLLRQPALTTTAVTTLALGLGATVAIFSTVNATLLRPLPYPRAADIRVLGTTMTDGRVTTGRIAPIEVTRLRDPNLSIERVAAVTAPFDVTLVRSDGSPALLTAATVGEEFFDLMGLPQAAGRPFTLAEHAMITGNTFPPPVAVISFRMWRDLFSLDRQVTSKSIRILEIDDPIAIIGVAAPGLDVPHGTDLWINLRIDPASQSHSFVGYARVRHGTAPERLRNELASVMGRLAREFPSIDSVRAYTVNTLVGSIVGDLGPTLLLILGAAGLLLALAWVNVTSLLLTNGAVRAREIGIRVALGATRGRIVRQILTESMVIAGAGTALGLGLAYISLKVLLRSGAASLPRLDAVPFDARVLMFAVIALAMTALFVGIVPALRLAGTDLAQFVNESSRSATAGRSQRRTLTTLVIAEVALAIVLVTGAGWLVRSFVNLQAANPGFTSDGRLIVNVIVPFAKYPGPPRVLGWSSEVRDRIRAIPGVRTVGASTVFPLGPRGSNVGVTYIQFLGRPADPDHPQPARYLSASTDFFEAMGVHLVAGRSFTLDDRQGTQPVAIVNRSFVRRYLAGQDPLTAQFAFGYPNIDPKTMRAIVGVIEDMKYRSLAEPPEPMVFLPEGQYPFWQQMIVISTDRMDPSALVTPVRTAIDSVDARLLQQFDTASHIVRESLILQRLGLMLMIVFAVAAMCLAAVGIYGTIAYASAQRRGEVAIRMALGAAPGDVFWLMVRQGRLLTIVGTLLGIASAMAIGRFADSQLYEVRASDPVILASASALVVAITVVAVVLPARRTARISPAGVLRLE